MKNYRFPLTLAASVLAASIAMPAGAQEKLRTGWYGQASVGYLQPEEASGTVDGTQVTLDYDSGYTLSAAAGYRFSNAVRLEGEISYGNTSLGSVSGNGATVNLNGDIDLWSFAAAAYYDFATGTMLTPYVGVGAGLVHQKLGAISATLNGTTVTAEGGTANDLTAFAEAGVGIALGKTLELVPSYRYLWIDNGANGIDDDTAHILRVGLRAWF